tara:strand:+ start:2655 stop:3260 length:606 start_codon:yes stop_codon:yes gene_type:complete
MDLIFGSGIHQENLNNPALNKKLEKLGRELMNSPNLKQKSNAGGLQAHAPDLKHPVLGEFFKAVMAPLNELVKHYHIAGDFSCGFQDLWFNLNRKGDYNLQHSHGGTDFSGTYYIKCAPGSGDLVLVNPNQSKFLLNLTSTFQFKEANAMNAYTYTIKTTPMELCVFPAELQHYVTRNNNKEDRLSLSFNVKINPIYEKPF